MRFRVVLKVLLGLSLVQPLVGWASSAIWQDSADEGVESRSAESLYYRALNADFPSLLSQLGTAPREFTSNLGATLELPMPDGTLQRFEVEESPIMEPGLAALYPEIHTYRAKGIDDSTATARLDVTPAGFHAMIQGASGTVFIDPNGSPGEYRSYFKSRYVAARGDEVEIPACSVHGSDASADVLRLPANVQARTGSQLRTYRLAVAATGEYTAFHGGQSSALSEIVTAINRVNQIYGRDLAVGFVLVANNNALIYTDSATDPYTNSNGVAMLSQNQANIDAVIGPANYDIGHVFSTGGGGIASLSSVCGGGKAQGVTGLPNPTGDPFYIDYVAHEIGHQFGANHTFNGTTGSCSGNRNASTAYEPGSGSTIMAYAGICGAENLQTNSDATFHAGSIAEINGFIGGAGSCFSGSATGNTAPTVNAGSNFTIPRQTPFTLTGSATDPDGHTLSYQWDEMDTGSSTTSGTIGSDLGSNALFRSFVPKDVGYRHLPRLTNQLTNTADIGETLASTARTLNFRLTSRDGQYGVDDDSMQVTVDSVSGPFQVTSPNGGENLTALFGTVNVTWNVAGTSGAPVSCANVDIELLTFNNSYASYCSALLADDTPNDGTEAGLTVTVANSNRARIRISCSDNIFFDISNADITVSGAGSSEPTNCVSTDGDTRAHGSVFVASDSNLNSGGVGGGGGGALGLWSLLAIGLFAVYQRSGVSFRHSV